MLGDDVTIAMAMPEASVAIAMAMTEVGIAIVTARKVKQNKKFLGYIEVSILSHIDL